MESLYSMTTMSTNSQSWRCRGQESQSQPLDAAEDQCEQRPGDRHLRQLEHHAPGVMDDLAAELAVTYEAVVPPDFMEQ